MKNHRDAILRFNCGNPNLKSVKATLYDNGELCFEGKGDVLQFENFPWLDSYDQQDDYPIESVTFEDGVTPVVMDNWFNGLETLEYVGKLPSSIESLNATFSGCIALKEGADWSACTNLKISMKRIVDVLLSPRYQQYRYLSWLLISYVRAHQNY